LSFAADPDFRNIDRITTLKASGKKLCSMTKGRRAGHARCTQLGSLPAINRSVHGRKGNPTAVAKLDNTVVNGQLFDE